MYKLLMLVLIAINVFLVLCADPEVATTVEVPAKSFLRMSMAGLNTSLLHEGLNNEPVDIHRFVYGI